MLGGSPGGSPTLHPWLPGERDASQQSEVEALVARAPVELRPKAMQVRHDAMKGDMDAQMRRIAAGLEARADCLEEARQLFEGAVRIDPRVDLPANRGVQPPRSWPKPRLPKSPGRGDRPVF